MRLLLFFMICSFTLFGQPVETTGLYDQYDQFREQSIQHRRFKHADIEPLILKLKKDPQFKVQVVGKSVEGRNIYLVSVGTGDKDVLLWSQMHGNEPTATMAIMDIFNFFTQPSDFDQLKTQLKKELTLHFIPMLNPDGAEKYQRRNALGVDLNRDALRLQQPESIVLKQVRDSLQAEWGFNLHDQSRYYAAGRNPETASISFLAPAFNYEKDVNRVRSDAMQLIGFMQEQLQKYIPGKIARYSDDFEPRAFGDNITKWGTRTILIEAGGLENDREKQYLRKLHFTILLAAFKSIAYGSYVNYPLKNYKQIPYNKYNAFHDLILREANVVKNARRYILDIAFRQSEMENESATDFVLRGQITDIGDLSTSYAYREIDAGKYLLVGAKTYPKVLNDLDEFRALDSWALMQKGIVRFKFKNIPSDLPFGIPLDFVSEETAALTPVNIGENPTLLLVNKGKAVYIVHNGSLYDLEKEGGLLKDSVEKL